MQIIQIKESLNIFEEHLIILSMPEVHNIQRAQCLIGLFKKEKKKKKRPEFIYATPLRFSYSHLPNMLLFNPYGH